MHLPQRLPAAATAVLRVQRSGRQPPRDRAGVEANELAAPLYRPALQLKAGERPVAPLPARLIEHYKPKCDAHRASRTQGALG